eukprot:748727-Hanusia_phi.AAC.7
MVRGERTECCEHLTSRQSRASWISCGRTALHSLLARRAASSFRGRTLPRLPAGGVRAGGEREIRHHLNEVVHADRQALVVVWRALSLPAATGAHDRQNYAMVPHLQGAPT